MIFYDADEYWHCEHGFGPLEFDTKGRFFRAIRDLAFLRVIPAGMSGSQLSLFFLTEQDDEQDVHCDFLVDGLSAPFITRVGESIIEVSLDVRGFSRDNEGGFVLEIRNSHPQAAEAIFAGVESPVLRLHRVGY